MHCYHFMISNYIMLWLQITQEGYQPNEQHVLLTLFHLIHVLY